MIQWPWMSHAHARVPMLKEIRRRIEAGLQLRGKTRPHRSEIKELGGIWSDVHGCWLMPDKESMVELGAVHDGNKWFIPKGD